jgi:hypothetical protein
LYVVDAIGPIRFAREDLAPLPWLVAFNQYLAWLLSLPLPQMKHEIAELLSNPRSVVNVAKPDGLTATIQLHFFGMCVGRHGRRSGRSVGVRPAARPTLSSEARERADADR